MDFREMRVSWPPLIGAGLFGLAGAGWSKREEAREIDEAVINQAIVGGIA